MFDVLMQEMKNKNFSPRTIELYVQYNQDFYNFIKKNPRDVAGADIRHYIFHLLGKQYSSSTIEIIQNALKMYLQCIHKRTNGVREEGVGGKVVNVREGPTKKEVHKMLEATKSSKHKIMMDLMYSLKISVGELVRVKVSDVDFNQKVLRLNARAVMLSESMVEQIKQYLRARPYQSKYLFASHEGHMTQTNVEKMVNTACYGARVNSQTWAWDEKRSDVGMEI
ncbi:hypothetical protein A2642_04730 [Candidatus Nomurabacteria bacterium RIFCSPHIGHO2_01_FULL_39_10]|uniref:Core-binding (CB) domain-containing protein n=1 Tax=Candidatus Nomurabacteria bacterium RIFCSPHIGHO2_01_FULL_39_10 TaxID=1801733 RepID=A0A1F6V743_9BACT|nr:MAG: hypothetical protein A2642_04730 [Candidatus Nomurabacteria bacterium RIFCSPHIGHO2_01_FULL_39_10]